MRVLCINDKWAGPPVEEGLPSPQIGDKDDVTGTVEFLGENYYILAAYGNNRGFMCRYFVTLPDQTADEIETETKEAIVNLETVPA